MCILSKVALLSYFFAGVILFGLPLRAVYRRAKRQGPASVRAVIVENIFLSATLCFLAFTWGLNLDALGLNEVGWGQGFLLAAEASGVVVGIDAGILILVLAGRRTSIVDPAKRNFTALVAISREQALPHVTRTSSFVSMLVITALWEELCFRAVPLAFARDLPSMIAIIVLSSFIFATHHFRQGARAVGFAFCYGLLFSAIYLWTEFFPAVVVAHAAGNAFSLFVVRPKLFSNCSGQDFEAQLPVIF